MATSKIKQDRVLQKEISVGGQEITTPGSGGHYYATKDLSNDLPADAKIVSVNWGENWQEDVNLNGHDRKIYFTTQISRTLSNARVVVVSYILGGGNRKVTPCNVAQVAA